VSALGLLLAGAGLLYYEYLIRMKQLKQQEARQKRLVRKLLDRQSLPLFSAPKKEKEERPSSLGSGFHNQGLWPRNGCVDCQLGISCSIRSHNPVSTSDKQMTENHKQQGQHKINKNKKVYRPSLNLFEADYSRSFLENKSFNDAEEDAEKFRYTVRGAPDGEDSPLQLEGEAGDRTMFKVIESAREVRRMIRNCSVDSLAESIESAPLCGNIESDSFVFEDAFTDDEIVFDQKLENSDFRHHLQLTCMEEDGWSGSRSDKSRRSVLSVSPSKELDFRSWEGEHSPIPETRKVFRETVLSSERMMSGMSGRLGMVENRMYESENLGKGELKKNHSKERNNSHKLPDTFSPMNEYKSKNQELLIKCGDITTSSTNISLHI